MEGYSAMVMVQGTKRINSYKAS